MCLRELQLSKLESIGWMAVCAVSARRDHGSHQVRSRSSRDETTPTPNHLASRSHDDRSEPMKYENSSQLERNFAALEQGETLLDNPLCASLTSPAPRGRIYWFLLDFWDWVETSGGYRCGIVARSRRRRAASRAQFPWAQFPWAQPDEQASHARLALWRHPVSRYRSPVNPNLVSSHVNPRSTRTSLVAFRKSKRACISLAREERLTPAKSHQGVVSHYQALKVRTDVA